MSSNDTSGQLQQVDLQLISLMVIGKGVVPYNTLQGNQNLLDSVERLLARGFVKIVGGNYRLTISGSYTAQKAGLYEPGGVTPSKNAHQYAHSQSSASQE